MDELFWLCFAAVAAGFMIRAMMQKPKGKDSAGYQDAVPPQAMAVQGQYRRAKELLTPTEAAFYPVLRRAAGSCPVVPKVRLADVVEPTDRRDLTAFRRVSQKHLDFVVVDPQTWRVLAAVELDDPSHQRREAQRRDAVKGQALANAGVPLVRVRAAHRYDAGEIAARLTPILRGAVVPGTAALKRAKCVEPGRRLGNEDHVHWGGEPGVHTQSGAGPADVPGAGGGDHLPDGR